MFSNHSRFQIICIMYIYKLFTAVNYFYINYLNNCMSTIKIFIRRLNSSIYNIKSIIADILF